jgi:cobalt/nickel transport system permease protein
VIVASFLAGAGSVLLSCLLLGLALYFTEKSFFEVSLLIITANLPVMIIEGVITGFIVTFLQRVYPEILPQKRRVT